MYSTCFLFFILFCASQVRCLRKEPCNLEDVKCVTDGLQSIYQNIVTGVPAIGLETSDPMHLDLTEAHFPNLNYTLSDCYCHGLKDCRIEKLQLVLKNMTWYSTMTCPLLTLKSNYHVRGTFNEYHIDEEGKCNIINDHYLFGIFGNMEKYTDPEGIPHANLTDFALNVMEVRGFVNYRFKNIKGDTEMSKTLHKYMNDNWKLMSTATQEPFVYAIIGKLVKNINMYLKAHNINHMYYKYV